MKNTMKNLLIILLIIIVAVGGGVFIGTNVLNKDEEQDNELKSDIEGINERLLSLEKKTTILEESFQEFSDSTNVEREEISKSEEFYWESEDLYLTVPVKWEIVANSCSIAGCTLKFDVDGIVVSLLSNKNIGNSFTDTLNNFRALPNTLLLEEGLRNTDGDSKFAYGQSDSTCTDACGGIPFEDRNNDTITLLLEHPTDNTEFLSISYPIKNENAVYKDILKLIDSVK